MGIAVRALLVVIALTLLLPKLLLVHFVNATLWGDVSASALPAVLAQDLLLSVLLFLGLERLVAQPSYLRLGLGVLASGLLILLLALDVRVRELFLRPTDWKLLGYAYQNLGDLESGAALFFNFGAGLGMTFRRLLALLAVVYVAEWAALIWTVRRRGPARPLPLAGGLIGVGCASLFMLLPVSTEGARYHMNENIFVRPVVLAVTGGARTVDHKAATRFEQPSRALSRQATRERTLLPDAAPFRNVVFVLFESVRWNGLNLDSPDTRAPQLARMAREGLFSRSYVTVPHSSKAYFALLTGRHPYPAVEMRESTFARHPSVFHQLKKQRGVKTFVFSSLFLAFENTRGLLEAIGLDEQVETKKLAADAGEVLAKHSSFGMRDEPLYRLGAARLAEQKEPFAALFMPVAAHYPYECTGGDPKADEYANYLNCVATSDELLGSMVAAFGKHGLLEDTLFVVVGDHGESFGEHGMYVHNSSMYEEEVTVPLVFWSADGRLRHDGVIPSRQIDVAPTIADLFGLMGADTPVQGVSLLRHTERQPVYIASFFDGVSQALVDYPHKYIYAPPTDTLVRYDLTTDPEERAGSTTEGSEKDEVLARLESFFAYQQQAFAPEH